MGIVNVQADGLNVRTAPNGPASMSLVNATPLFPLQKEEIGYSWLLDVTLRPHGRGHGQQVFRFIGVGYISNEKGTFSWDSNAAPGNRSSAR